MDKNDAKYSVRKRWLLFGLPWTFTIYNVGDDLLNIETGFFKKEENDCYMYKISDIKLTRTLGERIFGLGTITCYTSDTTDNVIIIKHVKQSVEIKDYMIKATEAARMRRRTVHMQDITADGIDDSLDLM